MLVLDFLQLINDINKNTQFFYRHDQEIRALTLVRVEANDGQSRLVIATAVREKSLHQWELLVLLNQSDYRQLPIYLEIDQHQQAVFGFKLADGKAWLR
ncbi:hypothetical protein ACFQ4L_08805 [Lapidilactobacillus mulanensis]|uniref:Uncharacterized protein n=1 Tax=Lapidilactobacillus mulanensis TaxID=2485999 RepID=A0ABW4DQQ8_9LACO|nr:hypothetical protein [Lapidilactobacillus mulanensis]